METDKQDTQMGLAPIYTTFKHFEMCLRTLNTTSATMTSPLEMLDEVLAPFSVMDKSKPVFLESTGYAKNAYDMAYVQQGMRELAEFRIHVWDSAEYFEYLDSLRGLDSLESSLRSETTP